MFDSIEDFIFIIVINIIFFSLLVLPAYLAWIMSGSILLTLFSLIFIGNPLSAIITFLIALKISNDDSDS